MYNPMLIQILASLIIVTIVGAFVFYRGKLQEDSKQTSDIKCLKDTMIEFRKSNEIEKNEIYKDINTKNEKLALMQNRLDTLEVKLDAHTKEYANESKEVSKSINNLALSMTKFDMTLQSLKETLIELKQK